MLLTLVAVSRLFRALVRAIRDPATRGLVALTAMILALGTAFYSLAEGWSVIESLYFSVVTLTTIGFGDLAPTRDATRLFTIVYSLVGIGVLAAFVTSLAVFARDDIERGRGGPRQRRRERRDHPGSGGADGDVDTDTG